VAKFVIPLEITTKVEDLKEDYEEYLKVGSLRKAVKTNYLYFLSFLSLIIIFLALWASLKISQEITNPLKELVQATNRVASGDFKVKILSQSTDEIGILVNSFNEMTEKLNQAYIDLSERNILLERMFSNITSGIMFIGYNGNIFKINEYDERSLDERRPDLVILIDYPDFNLPLAKAARKRGIKVFYYISPQVWAWRRGRIGKIKKTVNKMAVILPFEVDTYAREGFTVNYVGHPLLDLVKANYSKQESKKKFGLVENKITIGILPGSRFRKLKN